MTIQIIICEEISNDWIVLIEELSACHFLNADLNLNYEVSHIICVKSTPNLLKMHIKMNFIYQHQF